MSDSINRGERGATGDLGPKGSTGDEGLRGPKGDTGRQGMIGEHGLIGERGKQGDHGQHGEVGEQGRTGLTGVMSPDLKRLLTVLFLLLVALNLIFAFRSEMGTRSAKHAAELAATNAWLIQKQTYDLCQARNINLGRTNAYYRGQIAIEKDNPYKITSPSTISRRIKLYESAMLTPPNCGPKPKQG